MIAPDRSGLAAQAVWLFAARVVAQISLVVFTVVIARRLGPLAFGEYAFVAAALVVANVLTSFGTDMLLVREIAARRATGDVSAALVVQVALSAAAFLLALVAPEWPTQSPEAMAALRIALAALLPLAVYTVLSAMLRGARRIAEVAIVSAVAALVQLIAAFALIPEGGTAIDVAVVILLTQLAAAALAAAACVAARIALAPLWADPRPHLARLVRAAAPIALLGLLGMAYQRAGVLMLSSTLGAAATGLFAIGSRTVEASKTAHVAALGALYPRFAEAEGRGSGARPHASLALLLTLAAAIAAVLTLAADPLVALLFGPAFAPAAGTLRILAWALVPYAIASHRSTALVAERREAEVARGLAVALAVFIALGLWWIPVAGGEGVAWATLAAEVAQAGLLAIPRGALTAVGLARPAAPGR